MTNSIETQKIININCEITKWEYESNEERNDHQSNRELVKEFIDDPLYNALVDALGALVYNRNTDIDNLRFNTLIDTYSKLYSVRFTC